MAAMTPQPDYHDWPTKAECAKLLGCSAATLERMAKAGKLEVRYREVPKRRPEAVYNPTEIDRLIGERNPPFVAPAERDMNAIIAALDPNWKACAKLLGCSAATLERMAKDGKLEVRYREVPRRWPEAVYNPTEIDRMIGERNPPFVAAASTPRVPLSSKLYLTIDEAVEYSGLPASYLYRMIRGGGVLHVKADRWLRISRKSLERLDQ